MSKVVTSVAVALLLAACGAESGEPGTTTTPSSSTTVQSSTTTDAEATAPPMVGEAQTNAYASPEFPGAGPAALLTDVRTETYETYARIVFEFESAVPEYEIDYLAEPVAAPSGEPIDLAGSTFLGVTMAPASGVDLSGFEPEASYTGPERIQLDAGPMSELVKAEDFESHLSWVIGLDAELPFSFATLDGPPRLVIDIHTGDPQATAESLVAAGSALTEAAS